MNYDSIVISLILLTDCLGAIAGSICAWFAWLTLTDRRRARIKRIVSQVLHISAARR